MNHNVSVKLVKHDQSTILLGSVIGSAKLGGDGLLEVVGSGNTLEFCVKLDSGVRAVWRIDITAIASRAVLLTAEFGEVD